MLDNTRPALFRVLNTDSRLGGSLNKHDQYVELSFERVCGSYELHPGSVTPFVCLYLEACLQNDHWATLSTGFARASRCDG